jgi:ABC-type sugar transport system ATPase subunit
VNGNGATPDTALSIERITVRFGGLVAVSDMTFAVDEGEVVGLIGPNGAGKTTAFNVITGFLRPTGGEIRYRGRRLNDLRPHEVAEAGLVRTFQKTSVFAANTVFENILIGLHRRGRATPWQILLGLPGVRAEEQRLRDEARAILDFVAIAHRAGELGGALPYGEQRPLGNVELHAAARADPGTRRHRAAGRARYAHGHGRLRSRGGAQPGQDHRRRAAARDPGESGSDPRLPGRRGEACLRFGGCTAATARSAF